MVFRKVFISLPVRLFALLVAMALFTVVAEVILRITDVDVHIENRFFPVNRDINFTNIFKRDIHLFWRFRENIRTDSRKYSDVSYQINSIGLRGPDPEPEKRGYRILALGNSCTFGWGMEYKESWVYKLQERLNAQIPDRTFELINAGIPGYSSFQGLTAFKRELIKLHPDLVLIMFGWNDHWRAGSGITDEKQRSPNRLILHLYNGLSPLRLFQVIRKLIHSLTNREAAASLGDMVADLTSVRRVPREQFRENLTRLIHLSRERDIEPVLLVPPIASAEKYFGGSYFNLHILHSRYQNDIRTVAAVENVPIVDLQQAFDSRGDLYDKALQDPIHFNEKGQEVTAQSCARVVIPIVAPSVVPR